MRTPNSAMPVDHEEGGHGPPGRGHREHVAVAHGRDGADGPPQGIPEGVDGPAVTDLYQQAEGGSGHHNAQGDEQGVMELAGYQQPAGILQSQSPSPGSGIDGCRRN